MKRLYQKLAVTFILSSVLIAMLFTMSLYKRSREENCTYLNQLLESTYVNLETMSRDRQEKIEILKDDYLNRALAVELILSNDYERISGGGSGLAVLKELMEVKDISVIDKYGNITMSTTENQEVRYDDTEELDRLFEAEEEKAALFFTDAYTADEKVDCFHVLVKSDSEDFSAVRIDADVSRLGLLSDKELIKSTLKQATTEFATSIFAVDKTTGEILGMTENNLQQFQINGIKTEEELLNFLDMGKDKDALLVMVDGKKSQAVIHSLDGFYLAAFSDMEKVFGSVTRTFLEGLLGIGGISLLTVLLVHYHIKSMEKELSLAKTEAKYDRLTGLYNRSGFEKCMEDFLTQNKISGVLLLLDLDNFKKINDCEGHPEGDRILVKFSACLRKVFRREDSIGRLGGDEFIVLIQNEIPEAILEEKLGTVLEEVRKMLGEYREKHGASVSIGAVPIDSTVRSYEALYKYADAALYIAKYMGKNRFFINDKKITCAKEECSYYAENTDNNSAD